MEKNFKEVLKGTGMIEDFDNPHFKSTSKRWLKALQEMTKRKEMPKLVTFPVTNSGCSLVFKGPVYASSVCPHHLFPYSVEAFFAYMPKEMVVGISKIGRLLEWVCQELIVQEEIGPLFIRSFDKSVPSYGSVIYIRGRHSCEQMRGAKQRDAITTTVTRSGDFLTREVYDEFLRTLTLERS